MRYSRITIDTNGDGDGTGYSSPPVSGRLVAIQYVKGTYADGVDFTITGENSGVSLWSDTNVNASEVVYPSLLLDDQVGADTTTRALCPLLAERVKIVVASGGASKTGDFLVFWE